MALQRVGVIRFDTLPATQDERPTRALRRFGSRGDGGLFEATPRARIALHSPRDVLPLSFLVCGLA